MSNKGKHWTCNSWRVRPFVRRIKAEWGRHPSDVIGMLDKVKVTRLDALPDLSRAVAMENYYDTPLWEVNWSLVDTILIGGETTGLPRNDAIYKVKISTTNQFCLTVEAALAIGLYEWQRASTISK